MVRRRSQDEVKSFINLWFRESTGIRNSSYVKKLRLRVGERLKDLVKNPLRLSLLCASWQNQQGSFPETKAELYQGFCGNYF
jgi:predicted NACHT family NTPase